MTTPPCGFLTSSSLRILSNSSISSSFSSRRVGFLRSILQSVLNRDINVYSSCNRAKGYTVWNHKTNTSVTGWRAQTYIHQQKKAVMWWDSLRAKQQDHRLCRMWSKTWQQTEETYIKKAASKSISVDNDGMNDTATAELYKKNT